MTRSRASAATGCPPSGRHRSPGRPAGNRRDSRAASRGRGSGRTDRPRSRDSPASRPKAISDRPALPESSRERSESSARSISGSSSCRATPNGTSRSSSPARAVRTRALVPSAGAVAAARSLVLPIPAAPSINSADPCPSMEPDARVFEDSELSLTLEQRRHLSAICGLLHGCPDLHNRSAARGNASRAGP